MSKLDVINSMTIVEVDATGEELIYAIVDYTEENLQKLSKVVPDVDEYLRQSGDPDGTKESIDISIAAFKYAGAGYFQKGKFHEEDDELKAFNEFVGEATRDLLQTDKFIAIGKSDDYLFQSLVFLGEASEKISIARTILKYDMTLSNKDEIKKEFSEIQNKLEALKVRIRNNL